MPPSSCTRPSSASRKGNAFLRQTLRAPPRELLELLQLTLLDPSEIEAALPLHSSSQPVGDRLQQVGKHVDRQEEKAHVGLPPPHSGEKDRLLIRSDELRVEQILVVRIARGDHLVLVTFQNVAERGEGILHGATLRPSRKTAETRLMPKW